MFIGERNKKKNPNNITHVSAESKCLASLTTTMFSLQFNNVGERPYVCARVCVCSHSLNNHANSIIYIVSVCVCMCRYKGSASDGVQLK